MRLVLRVVEYCGGRGFGVGIICVFIVGMLVMVDYLGVYLKISIIGILG